jgi:uncharacterized membrane protein YfcA
MKYLARTVLGLFLAFVVVVVVAIFATATWSGLLGLGIAAVVVPALLWAMDRAWDEP